MVALAYKYVFADGEFRVVKGFVSRHSDTGDEVQLVLGEIGDHECPATGVDRNNSTRSLFANTTCARPTASSSSWMDF